MEKKITVNELYELINERLGDGEDGPEEFTLENLYSMFADVLEDSLTVHVELELTEREIFFLKTAIKAVTEIANRAKNKIIPVEDVCKKLI